jgi:hypothetical protein
MFKKAPPHELIRYTRKVKKMCKNKKDAEDI